MSSIPKHLQDPLLLVTALPMKYISIGDSIQMGLGKSRVVLFVHMMVTNGCQAELV